MMSTEPITGSLVLSFINCSREAWFMGHRIIPEQDNELISLGRLVHETSYTDVGERDITVDNMKLDLIEKKGKKLFVGEIKKSHKSLEGARYQLMFYLWRLKTMGVDADGVLLVPAERKREYVQLTDANIEELVEICNKIDLLLKMPIPSIQKAQSFCKSCGFYPLCWV